MIQHNDQYSQNRKLFEEIGETLPILRSSLSQEFGGYGAGWHRDAYQAAAR
jgi:hypothetical protein